MKKPIAISFLLAFLFAHAEFHQLLKLPVLIQHYLEHKQDNKDETFGNYLSQHYVQHIGHTHHDNHRDHEKLPFKANDCGAAHTPIAFLNQVPYSLPFPHEWLVEKSTLYKGAICFSTYSGKIWQPPKFS